MKIVFLTSRFPFPLEKGDKLRVFNQIKNLSDNNEINLICLNIGKVKDADVNELKKYCKNIFIFNLSKMDLGINLSRSLINGLPFQVSLFYKKSYRKRILGLIKNIKPDAVYCHLIRMSEYVKDSNGCPKTLDYMDAFSKGIERRAQKSSFFILKKFLRIEHKRLLDYERRIFDKFERKVIISEQDRNFIPHHEKEKIVILPNGVDNEIFYPLDREKKYELLFTGNMGYPPNIEGAIYAAKKILPLVHKMNPDAKLLIAGISPPKEIISLQSDRIDVIPRFSHIREAFAQSRILLAPMLTSIGLQNKILQAMAMKIPCICSPLANNAIKAPHNSCILEANTPEDYSEKIHLLLNDIGFYNKLINNAFEFVIENYNWKSINKKLEETIS